MPEFVNSTHKARVHEPDLIVMTSFIAIHRREYLVAILGREALCTEVLVIFLHLSRKIQCDCFLIHPYCCRI